MGVVTKYGRGFKDPNVASLASVAHAEGQLRCISSGALAVANGDSIASKHYFGKIPSSAIIIPGLSVLYHDALTSLTDYDIGLERDGTVIDIDILADGLDIHLAGSKGIAASVANADIGKRLYELAGLTTDPGYEYDIVGVLKAASGAAGVVSAVIVYAKK